MATAGVGIEVCADFSRVAVDDPTTKGGNSGSNPSTASLLANAAGGFSTPTCLSFTDSETALVVGAAAQRLARRSPQSTIEGSTILPMIGRRVDDPFLAAELPPSKTPLASGDQTGTNQGACLSVMKGEEPFCLAATEALGHMYADMYQIAWNSIGTAPEAAVIAVPAHWCSNPSRIAAVRLALAKCSGLKTIQICAAEALACVPYGITKNPKKSVGTVAVVTLGGNSMRVALLRLRGGKLRVEAVVTDSQISAKAFEDTLVKHFEKQMCKTDKGISDRSRRRLEAACVEATFKLSRTNCRDAPIYVEGGMSGGRDFNVRLSRSRFDMLVRGVIETCIARLQKALSDFGMVSEDGAIAVQTVVLAGDGMSLRRLQDRVRSLCVGARVLCSVPPEEVFVSGAAQHAALVAAQARPTEMWTKLSSPEASAQRGDINIRISSCAEIMVSGSCPRSAGGSMVIAAAACGGVVEVSEDGRILARLRLSVPPPPAGGGIAAPTAARVNWTVDVRGSKVTVTVTDAADPATVWQRCCLGGARDAVDAYASDAVSEDEEDEEEGDASLDEDEEDDDDLEVDLDEEDEDDDDLEVGLDEDDDEEEGGGLD